MTGFEMLGGLLIAVGHVALTEWFQDRRARRDWQRMNDELADLKGRCDQLSKDCAAESAKTAERVNTIDATRGAQVVEILDQLGKIERRLTQPGLEQHDTTQRVNHINDMSIRALIDRIRKLEGLPAVSARKGHTSDGRSDLIKGRRDS